MLTCLSLFTLLVPCLLQSATLDADGERLARKRVQETYADEYRDTSRDGRRALIQLLLERESATPEPALRRALVDEALDIAEEHGPAHRIVEVAVRLAGLRDPEFAYGHAYEALLRYERGDTSVDRRLARSRALIKLAARARAAQVFDVAKRALKSARSLASRADDSLLEERAAELLGELATVLRLTRRAEEAREALTSQPDDRQAHRDLGVFECRVEDDWDSGLRHLVRSGARGIDPLLEAEDDGPEEGAEQKALGDGWWDLAEASDDEDAAWVYARRARHWYASALDELEGFAADEARVRLGAPASALLPPEDATLTVEDRLGDWKVGARVVGARLELIHDVTATMTGTVSKVGKDRLVLDVEEQWRSPSSHKKIKASYTWVFRFEETQDPERRTLRLAPSTTGKRRFNWRGTVTLEGTRIVGMFGCDWTKMPGGGPHLNHELQLELAP